MGIDREVEKLSSEWLSEFIQMQSLLNESGALVTPKTQPGSYAVLLGHGLASLPALASCMLKALVIEAIEAEEAITGEAAI